MVSVVCRRRLIRNRTSKNLAEAIRVDPVETKILNLIRPRVQENLGIFRRLEVSRKPQRHFWFRDERARACQCEQGSEWNSPYRSSYLPILTFTLYDSG